MEVERPDPRRTARIAAAAYLASSAAGATIAIRESEPAAFAGRHLAGESVTRDFLRGAGTAYSAPAPMLLALGVLALMMRPRGRVGRLASWLVVALGCCFVIGQTGEPVAWRTLRRPREHPARTAIVVANITVPAVMSTLALRELRR